MLYGKKILIHLSPHLGDFCVCAPSFAYLKQKYRCDITVIIRKSTIPLASLCCSVDSIIVFEEWIKHTAYEALEQIKKQQYDVFLDLFYDNHQEHLNGYTLDIFPMFAQEARIPMRIGIGIRQDSSLYTHYKLASYKQYTEDHIARGFLKLLGNIGIEESVTFEALCSLQVYSNPPPVPWIEALVDQNVPTLLIHPGSLSRTRWPFQYYNTLLNLLEPLPLQVIITGATNELSMGNIVCSASAIDLQGKLSLTEFLYLLSKSSGLLSVSTGPAHLAAAFNTIPLTFFSQDPIESQAVWGPLSTKRVIIEAPSKCAACQFSNDLASLSICSCLRSITPEHALSVISKQLLYHI